MTDSAPFEIHHDHRDVTGGWLRPAVFGVSDGLGVQLRSDRRSCRGCVGSRGRRERGGTCRTRGLVAGACSMAAGEYVPVASQSELAMAEIELERS